MYPIGHWDRHCASNPSITLGWAVHSRHYVRRASISDQHDAFDELKHLSIDAVGLQHAALGHYAHSRRSHASSNGCTMHSTRVPPYLNDYYRLAYDLPHTFVEACLVTPLHGRNRTTLQPLIIATCVVTLGAISCSPFIKSRTDDGRNGCPGMERPFHGSDKRHEWILRY